MNKKIYLFLVIGVAISSFLFYWYEWRPSQIKKECHLSAKEKSWAYENVYKSCLNARGL